MTKEKYDKLKKFNYKFNLIYFQQLKWGKAQLFANGVAIARFTR